MTRATAPGTVKPLLATVATRGGPDMLTHDERIDSARAAVDYICGRSDEEMRLPIPNCPGWTVYHAASHIGRVGIAWGAMVDALPDDPDS